MNSREVSPNGAYVLYWMSAYRRTRSNFALQRSADWARHLGVPLLVVSALRLDYQWASDRIHAFILDGMQDVSKALARTAVEHLTYIEDTPGGGRGLFRACASRAAVVVTDDAPVFFLPEMAEVAAQQSPVALEAVDHNGLVPLAATDRVFLRAYDLRRFNQRELPAHLDQFPADGPLRRLPVAPPGLLDSIRRDWHGPSPDRALTAQLAIDHSVGATDLAGGQDAAAVALDRFVDGSLARYTDRNHPDEQATSGLSPYLHFGHISPHQVFDRIADAEGWNPGNLADHSSGAREGWWGMSSAAEGFLDQVVTWRELGYRAAATVPGNSQYSSVPKWARETLASHRADPRPHLYSREQVENAATADEIWNAAQRQLRTDGTIHTYLRMLWGKKILEWTADPEEAHAIMFELNDRYALDGRDPNSVSGIHWVFGRYDRPWGPERPIFGKVRYMSSDAARRKLRMANYLGQSSLLAT